MFEFNEHSIPALAAPIQEMTFVPLVTIVTELAEILTDETVLILMFWKTILMLLFVTSTLCVAEDPVTTTVSIET
jgi:hypothetical protein